MQPCPAWKGGGKIRSSLLYLNRVTSSLLPYFGVSDLLRVGSPATPPERKRREVALPPEAFLSPENLAAAGVKRFSGLLLGSDSACLPVEMFGLSESFVL
ncbi:unnamed protein product [Victoria cruziana]